MDYAALRTCTKCALSTTRQRVVIGSGPTNPVLMIVGEAPGASEDAGGEPFIGRSGQLLFRLLHETTGLTREDCFVTNVVKCRPPENRRPRPAELEACRGWFDQQFAEVSPRAVVTLGLTAAHALWQTRDAMKDLHGTPRTFQGRPALATYHPAAALRGGRVATTALREDLAQLARLVQ